MIKDTKRRLITITDEDDNEIELPAHFVVCERCEGTGKHVNPNIDGHGISPEEFREDPDFAESYFRGDYDVSCEVCGGDRVELVPDWDRMTEEQQRVLTVDINAEADYQAQCKAERDFGC